jgi:hypothetical protein
MTDETYETPKIALAKILKKKVKMTTFLLNDKISCILRTSLKGEDVKI